MVGAPQQSFQRHSRTTVGASQRSFQRLSRTTVGELVEPWVVPRSAASSGLVEPRMDGGTDPEAS